ncbi:hypothetical protein [Brucella tritici]|uniref:hypothetical protein n=1 Tax=Brucella tritici TaxID=94626 RepID=UPI000DD745CE|nr:hypothetical protein [Brucella tritici]
MHGRLDYHKSKVLNALHTTEANEQAESAQDHRFDDWFSDLFSVRYFIMVCMCCVATVIVIAQII